MVRRRFRLNKATLGIMRDDAGKPIPVMVPVNAIIEIAPDGINGSRLTNARWEQKTITMFTQDIRERGEEVEPTERG